LLRLCIDFEKNAFGYISEFGHKPIWSHWWAETFFGADGSEAFFLTE
jgi:hypothetical protein